MAKTKQQAYLWQTLGFAAFLGGAVLLATLFTMRGHARTTSPMLGAEIALAFIMLTGFALFGVGRLLNTYCHGYGKNESMAWRSTGIVMILAGMIAMVGQNVSLMGDFFHTMPNYDTLLIGVAGTSILSAGIGALLVDRLMQFSQSLPRA